jgi:predicted AlkP superfamily pyrophosphatase or phosphodiesterase
MRYAVLVLSLVLSIPTAMASAQAARPKLVVVLVVDQMRADYLVRYAGFFEHGFKRLTTGGAWFQNAAYPYMSTLTCVGHTTIGTGTLPYHHGIIQNAWFDRASGKSVTCTEDPQAAGIGYGGVTGNGESAHRMLAPSLAETMKKTAGARVVTMSLKPRSAIGLAGHAADAVIWLDDRGAWQTSSVYTGEPLAWVASFIRANPLDRDAGKTWERTLPVERYQGSDNPPGELGSSGWGSTFPHPLGVAGDRAYYAHWTVSPFADEYLEQMAEAAIDSLKLGKGDGTDFLGVSFSTLDLIGHAYGPRSHEVQDELVRLDRTLGRFLDALDQKVGRGNYVLALAADHGVADVPEQTEDGGHVLASVLSGAIDAVLKSASYGDGPFVEATAGSDVYLKPGVYDRLRADPQTVKALTDAMGKLSGVARVLTADDVSAPSARESKDPQIRAAALSYFPGRSGDLLVIPKVNWIIGAIVTTHGTLNSYDQRVPIVLYGAGIRPGKRSEAAMPADIAPTLAAVAGVMFGPVDGKVLTPALVK